MATILKKFRTAVENPELILPYLIRRLLPFFYSQIRKGYAPPPTALRLTVNNVCNMKCKMCEIGQKQEESSFYQIIVGSGRPSEISIDAFKRLIDDVGRYKPHIYINSTEPLLYKDLIMIIEYTVAHKLRCSVTTNGFLLEKFDHEFVELGLSELWISIDGIEKVHDYVRGVPGAFEKAYRGIVKLLDNRTVTRSNLPVVGIAYTISSHNYGQLVETAKIFKQAGVDRIVYGHLNFIDEDMAVRHNEEYGHLFGKVVPSSIAVTDCREVDTNILAEQINQLKREYADFVSFLPDIETREDIETYYFCSNLMGNNRCKIAWRSAQILTNGDVVVASRCGFSGVMGNINREPFSKIWNDKLYREFRRKISQVGATPACSRCCSLLGG